jgi:hypothetical protein
VSYDALFEGDRQLASIPRCGFPSLLVLFGPTRFGFAVWVRSRRLETYAKLGRAFE